MSATKWIEDGVAGGWNPIPQYYIVHPRLWGVEVSGDDGDRVKYALSELLLDPKFWQAVGKTRGWEDDVYIVNAFLFITALMGKNKTIEEALAAIE